MLTRRAIVLGSAASLSLLRAAPAEAAPKAEPWPRWERNDPGARKTVDHGAWGGFLARHVRPGGDGINRVGYGGVGQADRGLLKGYIAGLAGTAVSSIYVWFKADFGGDDAGVLRHLLTYGSPELARQLRGKGKINDHGYDWRLNDSGMV